MPASPLLEVAIVMAFLYFLGSQLVLSIYELWAGYRNVRGKFLYNKLRGTLGPETTEKLYAQAAIWALSPPEQKVPTEENRKKHWFKWWIGKDGIPAYIAPDLFASTLIGMISPTAATFAGDASLNQFRNDLNKAFDALSKDTQDNAAQPPSMEPPNTTPAANAPSPANDTTPVVDGDELPVAEPPRISLNTIKLLRQLLQAPAFSTEPPAPLATFQQTLAMWYDAYGERLTGWYKRRTRRWLLLIGLVVAVGANIDTPHVVRYLWTHPTLRSSLAEAATKAATSSTKSTAETSKTPAADSSVLGKTQTSIKAINQFTLDLRKTGFPIGRADTTFIRAAVVDSTTLPSLFFIYYPARTVRNTLIQANKSQTKIKALQKLPAYYVRYDRQDSTIIDPATKIETSWTWWKVTKLPDAPEIKRLVTNDNNRTPAFLAPPKPVPPRTVGEALEAHWKSLKHWLDPQPQPWELTLLGWGLTALALSLGAPFWFDLLCRFVNVRNLGIKPPRAAK